jgi:hypothetical protein
MQRTTLRVLAASAAITGFAGCSLGHRLSPEAFRRGMPLAIVTVCASPRIRYTETRMVSNGSGRADIGGTGFDAGDARPALAATKAAVVRALSRGGPFRLVPEQTVLSSAAYASAPAQPRNTFTRDLLTATGYKYTFDEAQAARIARGVGAAGALMVSIDLNYTTQGVPGGRIAGKVHVLLTAVDRSGRTIWTDWTQELSQQTLESATLRVPTSALEPLLADSAERGTRALLARLDEQLRAAR